MKLTAQVKLQPTPEQHESLLQTLQEANAACDWISQQAFNAKVFGQFSLHKIVYHPARERFNLSAQMVVRAIAKVADAYQISKKKQRGFKLRGAFPYDNRILSWKLDKRAVSIWTVDGREKIPFVCHERAFELLQGDRGEADLCFIGGAFYLFVACEVETPEPIDVDEYLGIDMGIVNVASDSDGNQYSGSHMLSVRGRRFRQRKRLQSKQTKNANRVLRRLSGREKRFVKQENHRISKEIVDRARRTGRGIAIENLQGIRDRIRASRSQRRNLHSWSFYQLQSFILYKAALAGIPVVTLDPAYSSQTCSECGRVSKSNRKSQSSFVCQSCGYAGHADHNAACNLASWAVRNSATQLVPS